jgi:hypothetical protein
VQSGKRNLQTNNVTFGTAKAPQADGRACIITNSRYQRYRVNIAGGFTHATGVEMETEMLGGGR